MLHYKVILHVPVILLLYYALLYYKISSEDITVIVSGWRISSGSCARV